MSRRVATVSQVEEAARLATWVDRRSGCRGELRPNIWSWHHLHALDRVYAVTLYGSVRPTINAL